MLKLTATELPRFMTCNGFKSLEKNPIHKQPSTDKDDGDAAHWLIETVLKTGTDLSEWVDRKAPNGVYITADMSEYCEDFISSLDGQGEVEVETSHSGEGWAVAGRADRVAVVGNTLYVDDFKYGYRIVEPVKNWTLISHALGYLNRNPADIDVFMFRIFQPRALHHEGQVRVWTVEREMLYEVYVTEMLNKLANPDNLLNTSSHCLHCSRRQSCPANQNASMNSIDVSEKAFNAEMKPEDMELAYIELKRASKIIKETMKAYEDHMIHNAKTGTIYENFGLERQYGRHKWKQEVTPELLEVLTGVDLSKKTLITPLQAIKKNVPEAAIRSFYDKQQTGLKLTQMKASKRAEQFFKRRT